VFFWPWRAAVVSSSPERLDPASRRLKRWNPPITDKLISVLAFHGQHALGTVIALAERPEPRRWSAKPDLRERWPSRLVATAAENRLSFERNPLTSFAAVSDCRTIAIYEYAP
jgi:hypothetical protein